MGDRSRLRDTVETTHGTWVKCVISTGEVGLGSRSDYELPPRNLKLIVATVAVRSWRNVVTRRSGETFLVTCFTHHVNRRQNTNVFSQLTPFGWHIKFCTNVFLVSLCALGHSTVPFSHLSPSLGYIKPSARHQGLSPLSFHHHIKMVKQKAVCRILYIRKFLRSPNLSLQAKLTLY